MLNKIKNFFDERLILGAVSGDPDTEHVLRLAIGALLLEMTHMDGEVWPEQRAAVEAAVLDQFDLEEDEAKELLELSEAERSESTDYFQFTSLINDVYMQDDKIRLIELLWKIAFANESLHKYEEHMVRRIADLLHVSHKAFIAAKFKARGDD
jgi:uncharacterized tellurite resistance protein B-like protein